MAKFQQRHYEMLAEVLHNVKPCDKSKSETRNEYRERIIRRLCEVFAADNPNFNEDRFRVAAASGQDTRTRVVGPAMQYVRPRR